MSIQITGLGAILPEKTITNDDLSQIVDTNDEWIFTRTGIKERHVAQSDNIVTLGLRAGEMAIENAKIDKQEIELIICATITPYLVTPPNASEIRNRLGIDHAVAFDINAQCTGFIYATAIAQSMMDSMGYNNALIIGSDILSMVTDWEDRSTCVLFGDGAGAAVLKKSSDNASGIRCIYLEGKNDVDACLRCYAVENRSIYSTAEKKDPYMRMKGSKVFSFAVNAMIGSITHLLDETGLHLEDIDWIVPHQANSRIISSTATRLGLDLSHFYVNVQSTGNTSSASIPIALCGLYNSGQLKKGDKVILVGFGAGLSSGAVLLEW